MIRFCPGCQQSDESPRHSVVTSLADMTSADFHYGCHARLGCPLCLAVVYDARSIGVDHTDGAALTAHLEAHDPAGAHIAAGGAHL
jgi:hypothetical protein